MFIIPEFNILFTSNTIFLLKSKFLAFEIISPIAKAVPEGASTLCRWCASSTSESYFSAIQSIPVMSKNAGHVYVFQRTANFAIPAHNGPIPEERTNHVKSNYPEIRQKAKELYAGFYQTYNDYSYFLYTC